MQIFYTLDEFLADLQALPEKCHDELISEETTVSRLKNFSFPASIDVYIEGKVIFELMTVQDVGIYLSFWLIHLSGSSKHTVAIKPL